MVDPASELELVLLSRGLIVRSPEVTAMLYRRQAVAPAISEGCAALLGDALQQAWPAVWRRGGTQPGVSLEGDRARRGRIWERHAPTGLTFSSATLALLQWLLATPLTAPLATLTVLPAAPLTIGDQVMIYLALDAATDERGYAAAVGQTAFPLGAADGQAPAVGHAAASAGGRGDAAVVQAGRRGRDADGVLAAIAAQPLVRAAPLAWLGFASRLAGPPPAFDALCTGAGAIVVEALSDELARRWRAVEHAKRAMTSPEGLIALGAAQDATLHDFLAACDRHRRRDLAGFVIDAAAPLIAEDLAPLPVQLDPTAPLARRATARVAAGALLRGVLTWAAWDQAHRGVRFLDDDYAAAQVLLARFERIQASGAARAAAWLADLAALAPTTRPPSAATVDAT